MYPIFYLNQIPFLTFPLLGKNINSRCCLLGCTGTHGFLENTKRNPSKPALCKKSRTVKPRIKTPDYAAVILKKSKFFLSFYMNLHINIMPTIVAKKYIRINVNGFFTSWQIWFETIFNRLTEYPASWLLSSQLVLTTIWDKKL